MERIVCMWIPKFSFEILFILLAWNIRLIKLAIVFYSYFLNIVKFDDFPVCIVFSYLSFYIVKKKES